MLHCLNRKLKASLCACAVLAAVAAIRATLSADESVKDERASEAALPRVRATPLDNQLLHDMGIAKTAVEVEIPEGAKRTIIRRVYRSGKIDAKLSSAIEELNTIRSQPLSLALLDPDVMHPEPSADIKVFGSLPPAWIKVKNKNWSLSPARPGPFKMGDEVKILELGVDSTYAGGSMIDVQALIARSAFRVTIHLRVDPMTADDRQWLEKHNNRSRSVKLEPLSVDE